MNSHDLSLLIQNRSAAEAWAKVGVHVFPCDPQTKKPLIQGWRSTEVLARLQRSQFPCAMPALDCEHVGIVVIDCDKSGDVDGEANFRSLCADLRVALDNVPLLRTPAVERTSTSIALQTAVFAIVRARSRATSMYAAMAALSSRPGRFDRPAGWG
jgi:hypothetical protein